MTEAMRIGVAGLGTVGAALVDVLRRNGEAIAARAGRPIEVTAVSARDRSRDRGVDLSAVAWHDDPVGLADDPRVDVVVELIGGDDGPALGAVERAFAAGKDVVTANKAMVAQHGASLALKAESQGAGFAFEAAVAGGIPILKALREGLAANRIGRVYGILNGTCNYILTTMESEGRGFGDVLAEAQALGYAEADPTFDVDGIDTAHKLAVIAGLAFGAAPAFGAVTVEGIRSIDAVDIAFARELGYRIKLLGVAALTEDGLEQRVQPCMVPIDSPIAGVGGVLNGVVVEGDAVGSVVFEGPGAGGEATASAVIADLVDLARGHRPPAFGIPARRLRQAPAAPLGGHVGAYYLRLMVVDQPGVLAEVATILRDDAISIETLLQRSRDPGQIVPIVITVHETSEAAMMAALDRIGRLDVVRETPRMLRIERL
ncbi:homoserine dehydrogenase [Marinivivus vitaminiproducens]|uniref:homoserine dehydrogenase n=1 Tax=Marinivivus vitaminiproducens TaxID=3035935 RepID=UPI0027A15CAC|nr:homoserine dehydrogenase [Geminicoccaceae bacterium SCSIO 64248]